MMSTTIHRVRSKRQMRKEGSSGHLDESRYLSKEYCRKYWMGELQQEIRDAETY